MFSKPNMFDRLCPCSRSSGVGLNENQIVWYPNKCTTHNNNQICRGIYQEDDKMDYMIVWAKLLQLIWYTLHFKRVGVCWK